MLHVELSGVEGYLSFEDDALPRELFVCQFGEEACAPGYGFGPTVRSYYLIHFVRSGRGKLHCGGRVCPVGPGQGFLILPGEETYYQASFEQPWHYAWVGYRGTQAEYLTRMAGLDDMHRVFTPDDPALVWQAMEQMRREGRTLSLTQISAVGNLLRMISMIAPAHNPVVAGGTARQYCEKAKWYLEGRFDRDVSIQETADFVGLSRSQLYRVMMEQLGCSPRRLLAEIRIRHAQQLLKTTSLTMEEIARRIGLCTGAQFGTLFRSMQGISPGKYRQLEREKEAAPQRLER